MADPVAMDESSVPRGGLADERSRLAAGALVLGLVSPVAMVVAAVTLVVLMGQVRRGWREVAWVMGPLSLAVAVLLVLAGVPGGWLTGMVVLGVPLGVAAGACWVGLWERWAGGADWHPAEQHRRAVADVRDQVRVDALSRPEEVAKCDVPVLGVWRGGDLEPWRRGDYVVPPDVQVPAMGLFGESGSGKTVTIEQLIRLWTAWGYRIILADFKGSDPDLQARVIGAVLSARPGASCRVWPTEPLDMWRGDPVEVANRLLQVQAFTEPFYGLAAENAVRLAVNAPNDPPVRDSAQFMRRLTLEYLTTAYENTPEADTVNSLRMGDVMAGVRLRYAGFFAALGSQFDGGSSWGDADLTVMAIPTLAQPSDAMAAARMMLADFGQYCMQRKPRHERVVFIADEFSAVTGAAEPVYHLGERVRDANGMVVVSVQSFEGLGESQDERMRMLKALAPGGIILHRTTDPVEVLKLAGTRHETDLQWHLGPAGHNGRASVRMNRHLTVDPNEAQRLRTGDAYVFTHGRWAKMSVLPSAIPPAAAAEARQRIQLARARQARMAADQQAWLAQQRAAAQATADVQAAAAPEPVGAPARRGNGARRPRRGTGAAAGQQTLLDVDGELRPWD